MQKLFRKEMSDHEGDTTLLQEILDSTLVAIGRPTLLEHVSEFGPKQWEKTAFLLQNHSKMLSQSFMSIAELLRILEADLSTWATAAIYGHSKASKLYPFSPENYISLQAAHITTVS